MFIKTFLGLATFTLFAGCTTTQARNTVGCDTTSLDDVINNPVENAGKSFCGEAYIVKYGGSTRIVRDLNEMPPSTDLALLVATDGLQNLTELSEIPRRFYFEAQVEVMEECFRPSQSGEDCSPYRRPIVFHIRRAQAR